MTRLSRRVKKLGGICGHIFTTIKTAGADSSPGPSLHKTPSVKPPWDSCHSSAHSATSHPCFPGQVDILMFQVSITGFKRAREFGTQLTFIFRGQSEDTMARPTQDILRLPVTILGRRSDSLPGTTIFGSLARSRVPAILALLKRQINKVKYRLNLPAHYRNFSTIHVSLLKPYTNLLIPSSPGSGAEDVPPPPVDPAEDNICHVYTILDS